VIEYGFQLHPDSFPVDCFLAKTIYQPENESGCIYFFSTPSHVFGKDIPFHWPSSARANGKECPAMARRSSPKRKACQGHDTKRSDWHDPVRLKPGRRHRINHTMTRSQKRTKRRISTHRFFQRAGLLMI
jgi:hypothetical protein